jgi:hypothetical protein
MVKRTRMLKIRRDNHMGCQRELGTSQKSIRAQVAAKPSDDKVGHMTGASVVKYGILYK